MKQALALVLTCALVFLLAGCGGTTDLEAASAPAAAPASTGADGSTPEATDSVPMKVGTIFTVSGLGDGNFNDMVFAGLTRAAEDFGIVFEYSEPSSDGEIMSMAYSFAQDGSYDVIIALSAEGATAVEEVASQYPEQMFTIIDASVDLPNVRSIVKAAPEQGFLTGVMAGLLTVDTSYEFINEEKAVGTIVGADFPIPRAFSVGFACGARFYDPEVRVEEAIVGDFSDVTKMKELSLSMYDRGVDVIQNIAGTGLGIFTAAEEKGFYCFGSGANQNANYPDYIIATAGFILTELVYQDVVNWMDGSWEPVLFQPGMRDGVFDYLRDDSNVELSEELIAKVEAARNWYMENEDVTLPSTVDGIDAWVEQYAGSLA